DHHGAGRIDPELVERRLELEGAARHVRVIRLPQGDLGGRIDLRAGLVGGQAADLDLAGEDEGAGSLATGSEPAVDQELVEPLLALHGPYGCAGGAGSMMLNSTRRLAARPAAVLLSPTGL